MIMGPPKHLVIDGGDILIGVQAGVQHTCYTADSVRTLKGSAHFVCANSCDSVVFPVPRPTTDHRQTHRASA
jgi:hypothetical protein